MTAHRQVIHDADNVVVRAALREMGFLAPLGLTARSYPQHTDLAGYNPHCAIDPDTGEFFDIISTPNPHAYLAEQRKVFEWARRNVHDAAYLAYILHGNREQNIFAKIFHAFAAMNVMAAMHPVNIKGEHWAKVQGNIKIDWREFIDNINPNEWTASHDESGVNYIWLASAIGGFVTLNDEWQPVQDFNDSGWAVFDRQHGGHDGLTQAGDIRRATNIVVIPPADIPVWTHSPIETSEPLFEWSAERYMIYLTAVSKIIPINPSGG